MASTVAGVVAESGARPAAARRHVHQFYTGVTLLLIAMVAVGFWPSYFGPLTRGGVTRPWVIHLHGAIFSGWMALLLFQVSLASAGRVQLHRRVGSLGIAYGALVLGLGIVVSFAAPVLHVRAGEWTVDRAAAFMLLPLVDMVLFAGFFGAAIRYRRKPEIHKRLVLAATVALAFAAAARMSFPSPLLFLLVWLFPLLIAMTFDVVSRGRVHSVNVLSVAVFSLAFVRIFYQESETWLTIGRSLLRPFL